MIDICYNPCHVLRFTALFWKGRLGKTCLSKMQSNQMETLSLNSTKVSCQIERSQRAQQVFKCVWGAWLDLLNKNATRCNLKPYNKFWPELGI